MLNHQLQGVMAVYNRAEYAVERHEAARRWADTLHAITDGQQDVKRSLGSISTVTRTPQELSSAPSSPVPESTPSPDDGQRPDHDSWPTNKCAAATGDSEVHAA
jgi:hypothetical protein